MHVVVFLPMNYAPCRINIGAVANRDPSNNLGLRGVRLDELAGRQGFNRSPHNTLGLPIDYRLASNRVLRLEPRLQSYLMAEPPGGNIAH